MVGNTWKANKKPILEGSNRSPNRKIEPWRVNSSTTTKKELIFSNSQATAGTFKISTAKTNWQSMPVITRRQAMALRFSLISTKSPMMTAMPKRPLKPLKNSMFTP